MTRLFVDEREVSAPPPAFSSLEEVIRHVEANLLPPNSIIRQVSLDGEPIDADSCQADPSMILGDLARRERIDVFTCTIREIALDSIKEADRYLERVEAITPSIAAAFRAYPGPEAFENLKQLYDGFYWLNMLLSRLQTVFNLNVEAKRAGGASLKEHNQRFTTLLQQLVRGHEQGDFVLMADLLEFEVLPMIPVWKSLLADIAGSAGSE